MEHGGAFLRYETPVLGPPWSIPFEFPLYQAIVALLNEHLHVPLNESGRIVSIAFFWLCFFPLASILKRLRYTPVQTLAILALFAVSPLYIFVSRLFMIESTGLFFSLLYLDMIFRLVTGTTPWRYRYMVGATIFGALAGAVKVNMFLIFLLLGSSLTAWQLWKGYRTHAMPLSRVAAAFALCAVVPFGVTVWWTEFAAMVRDRNAISAFYLSRPAMFQWNFGTLTDRLDPAKYMTLVHHIAGQAGSLPLLLLLVLVYAILVRRWNVHALVSLALYIAATMIFFNLHVIHEYYPYANAIFLVLAAGFLIADLLSLPGRRAWVGFALFVILIVTCIVRYRGSYYRIQQFNAPGYPGVAAIVQGTTRPGDVVLSTGLGWSSELPYEIHRRTISDFWVGSATYPDPSEPIFAAIRTQGAATIPEMIACDDARGTRRTEGYLKLLGIPDSTTLHADNCDVYLRTPK